MAWPTHQQLARLEKGGEELFVAALVSEGREDLVDIIKDSTPIGGTFFQKFKEVFHCRSVDGRLLPGAIGEKKEEGNLLVLEFDDGYERGTLYAVGFREGPDKRLWKMRVFGDADGIAGVWLEGRLNGELQDGRYGTAAWVEYTEDSRGDLRGGERWKVRLTEKSHYTSGKLWDPDEGTPALTQWWPNGNLCRVEFRRGNLLRERRDGGPSVTLFYENGQKKREEWVRAWEGREEHHRNPKIGPARLFYHPDGSIDSSAYFLEGEGLSEAELLADYQVDVRKRTVALKKGGGRGGTRRASKGERVV